ncbi:carbon catabolite repressor protein 4 homolog 3-like [Papaver somniferum]|uniref:carbon catabolite repressor protein 4 homolog 3-like n=1 Tax=Papaver somniferum TaxID=3469 RepID=UPI000E6FFBD6|nr:carbon catabolite repressor protein 4 homolog 3-like [Papaver somniferum]
MALEALSLSFSSQALFSRKTFHGRSLRSCCFSRTSLSINICNRIERWYNPNSNKTFVHPKIIRRWVESDSPPPHSNDKFTVVSYNVLSEKNASKHGGLYSNVACQFVNWDYRKKLICEELIGLDSDIICLQEVDRYNDLSATMEKEGYVGNYKRRTGDATDGCAMFWKPNVFKLLEGESIEFKEFELRDNIAQLSVFEMCNADTSRILVGNIHVLFNQNRGDMKLGQIRLLLSKAHALSEKWGNIPMVLAGDFNITPQSAVYKFLSSSELNITLHDRKDLSGQKSRHPAQFTGGKLKPGILKDSDFEYCWTDEEIEYATGDSSKTVLENPLKLRSSYATVKGTARDSLGEPSATSYHSMFLGTVDYIWYSNDLVPTRVLDTPSINLLLKTRGLPNKHLGSDHLALGSEFSFTDCNKEDKNGSTTTAASTAATEIVE